jgi:hypothetical protein
LSRSRVSVELRSKILVIEFRIFRIFVLFALSRQCRTAKQNLFGYQKLIPK